MLDFDNTLMICGLEASTILLNIYIDLITLSIMFKEIEKLVFLMKYKIPGTLR